MRLATKVPTLLVIHPPAPSLSGQERASKAIPGALCVPPLHRASPPARPPSISRPRPHVRLRATAEQLGQPAGVQQVAV